MKLASKFLKTSSEKYWSWTYKNILKRSDVLTNWIKHCSCFIVHSELTGLTTKTSQQIDDVLTRNQKNDCRVDSLLVHIQYRTIATPNSEVKNNAQTGSQHWIKPRSQSQLDRFLPFARKKSPSNFDRNLLYASRFKHLSPVLVHVCVPVGSFVPPPVRFGCLSCIVGSVSWTSLQPCSWKVFRRKSLIYRSYFELIIGF